MGTATALPGVELARSVLGLAYGEIARAVQADESTLYRWRQGQAPTAVYMSRLERLDDLAHEIQRTMRPEAIEDWLDRAIPALSGKTPREMILKGRSETVLGMLISLNAGYSL
jgi:hypothetical protein